MRFNKLLSLDVQSGILELRCAVVRRHCRDLALLLPARLQMDDEPPVVQDQGVLDQSGASVRQFVPAGIGCSAMFHSVASRVAASARLFLAIGVFFFPTASIADELSCGPLENAFGPFDYRDPEARENLRMVEDFHFNSDVENLVKGLSATIYGDLDYTLRAFPNHHRALYTVVRYHLAGNRAIARPVECYFDRAIRFRPDDSRVHLIQGIFLQKSGRLQEGIKSYRKAAELDPAFSEAHYNLSLALLTANDAVGANRHAQIAYRLGYPLPGLRARLKRLGAWDTEIVLNAEQSPPAR